MSQQRDAVSRKCSNCGANLDAAPEGTTLHCRYCGTAYQAPAQAPPPQRIVVIQPSAQPAWSPARRAARGPVFGVFFALLIGGTAAFISWRGQSTAITSLTSLPSLPSFPSDLVAAATSSFMWDTVAGPPMPAAVGAGGGTAVEGFVGRVRAHGDDMLWIAGYEGATLGQIWKVGPFGTYTQGYQSTFTSVVGHDVVVTDYRANVHVYDVATGKETRTLKLTDRAKSMCAGPDGKASDTRSADGKPSGGGARVWIEVSDEKNVMLDVDAGTLSQASRPAWCPDLWAASDDCRGWLKRGPPRLECKTAEAAPKVPGFEALNVIEEGDLGVALGTKHPGSALPIVVGFDPKTKTVRWQESLAAGDQAGVAESSTTSLMDAMAGGRFAAPYELTSKGWHFAAFDARSGQRIWDVPLQSQIGVDEPEGFSLTPARLYVMRTSTLEVYDAKTGALIGTIGG
ncbi:MAG TPA: PQQ-binding-like beta-propeller repeat protein [Polyangiaceae bacterium]|jgi:hypothetical protein|nr:PQQ-binding-like beta-propeller repeat protein [Polyangiaceae bacterium]